nr:hypothetical protein [Streptomyces sp. SID685]
MWPAFHRFAAGHRAGIQVAPGAHPGYTRDPGTGEPALAATVTVRADKEISHDTARPSRIDLPVRVWCPAGRSPPEMPGAGWTPSAVMRVWGTRQFRRAGTRVSSAPSAHG